MPKETFVAKYLDEMVGLLVGSFSASEQTSHKMGEAHWAADGKFMIAQMQRAKALLGRMWEEMHKPPEKKP